MAIYARLDQHHEQADRRRSPRRRLRLEAPATSASPHTRVVIHDLSLTGFLIEAAYDLPVKGQLEVEIPEAGAVEAQIVWNSGRFYGCRFTQPLTQAALSAALLRSPAHPLAEEASSEMIGDTLAELRALRARVRQITATVDGAIDQLGREAKREIRPRKDLDDATDLPEVQERDRPLPPAARMGIALLLSLALWSLLLWAVGIF